MEGRVVIQSDNFACDGHCSVRSMKTDEQSRRSHLTSPSGRSSRTSFSYRPSGPSLRFFSLSVNLVLSLSISAAANQWFLSRSFSLSIDLDRKSQHLSHMEALWWSSVTEIDTTQPAIKIKLGRKLWLLT
ncbi:uncharacterized protein LOC114319803 isoform X2 [Camellia sinensis]|uniref:uncharacterized protein LOC114319803 isoform X2 n=1 Tax=Camellia sinensis TaxID=4442 RepID=UPI0010363A12|nr:uncharacterized protein LOC114319803 isoform X2 [Camellia sinensis]